MVEISSFRRMPVLWKDLKWPRVSKKNIVINCHFDLNIQNEIHILNRLYISTLLSKNPRQSTCILLASVFAYGLAESVNLWDAQKHRLLLGKLVLHTSTYNVYCLYISRIATARKVKVHYGNTGYGVFKRGVQN